MPKNFCRVVRLLILIMFAAPGMVQSESIFIDRPGKEFSSNRLPQARTSNDGYDTAGHTGNGNLWSQRQDRSASQLRYPDSNRHNTAKQDNPWRSDGRVYTNPQHKVRPWGGVPADAPAPLEQQQREYGSTNGTFPRYQPHYYPYQPPPMRLHSMPGYGGYGNAWSPPYGAGHMPGYGRGGNQFFPFGSFGGMPGPGMPGGMFW